MGGSINGATPKIDGFLYVFVRLPQSRQPPRDTVINQFASQRSEDDAKNIRTGIYWDAGTKA